MPDRIEMHVVHMTSEVAVVTNLVLPIAPLPNTPLTLAQPARANRFRPRQPPRKAGLDERPALWIIRIAFRQAPNRMQVIGQHHHRDDFEGMALPNQSHRGAQQLDVCGHQIALAIGEIDREEEGAARHE